MVPGLHVGAVFSIGCGYWYMTTYDLVYSSDKDITLVFLFAVFNLFCLKTIFN